MELFYRHFGSGQPLVILHGIFGISDNWVTIGKRLAEKFSVYIPDQRNHGQSPHSAAFDYHVLAADLEEFLDQHALEDPVIIGHSMGGKVAMRFAMDQPERLHRLVVVDISPRRYPPRPIHQAMLSAMLSVNFDAVRSRSEVASLLEVSVPNPRIRQFILKNLYRPEHGSLAWRPNLNAINEHLADIFEGFDSGIPYDGPALFVAGGRSDYITEEDHSLIRKLFPQASIEVIPEASHWVHADQPDALCALFSRFLEKHCSFMP